MPLQLSNEALAIETLFNIQTKEGITVPYKLNNAQATLDGIDSQTERRRIIIAKARQKGFSSIVLAKFSIRCLGRQGTHAVCVSHEADATQRLFDKTSFYLKHMNGPQPIFGRHSRRELYFDKMDSAYYIGTAGAQAFGRGDFITDLHCSEYAWWEDPTKHSAGLFQAVPMLSGRIYIESTGNGRNNDFYYFWENALAMQYTRLFYPWYADEEYSMPLPKDMLSWKPDTPPHNEYMRELQAKHFLKDVQIYWYEIKLREMRGNLAEMQQEYPSDPDECFQASGGAVFPNAKLTMLPERWKEGQYNGYYINKLEGHPIKGFHYVLGADPSGGTGGDDASFEIGCVETNEQVFEFYNNRCNPILFGDVICSIGKLYNEAFIVCESNNHGAAVIPYLKDNYEKSQIYKRKYSTKTSPAIYGWNNSDITKHALIGVMQENIDDFYFHGLKTVKELKGFEEKDGKLGGASDNLVIASGLMMLGMEKFQSYREEYNKPPKEKKKVETDYAYVTLEEALDNLRKRKHSGGGDTAMAQVGIPFIDNY